MKKVWIFVVLLLIFSPLFLSAENKTVKGIKLGLNIANVYGDIDSTESVTGIAVGVFIRKPLSNNFSIQPEIYYSQKGYGLPGNDQSGESPNSYSLNYLEAPVLFVYTIPKTNFDLFAGPYVSIFLNGSVSFNFWGFNMSVDIPSGEMNTFDVGAVLGGMYSIKQLYIDFRGSFGLTNFPSDGTNLKNYMFRISGGLRL